MKKQVLLLVLLLLLRVPLLAQTVIGLLGNAPDGGPSGTGPSTASQVVTFYSDATTPSDPLLRATYTLSNQQYESIEGHPHTPGIVFGSGIAAGHNAVTPDLLYPAMGSYGSDNNNYTACYSCVPGTGIDISRSHAIQVQSFTDALIDATGANLKPVNARVWFADITISFNTPVSNPVFHCTGLGAWVYKRFISNGVATNYDLGFSTELELLSPGLGLSRLSGSSSFNVVSGTTIKNTATYYSDGNPIHGIARYSASGSVAVLGTHISTITFRIFIKGDSGVIIDDAGVQVSATNGNYVAWSLADTARDPSVITTAGDGFLLGISLKTTPESSLRLLSFQGATDKNCFPQLTWATTDEMNFGHFELQRSIDGITFNTIAEVAALHIKGKNNYEFTDTASFNQEVYYKLNMIDREGRQSYSATSKIKGCESRERITIQADPVTETLRIFPVKAGDLIELTNTAEQVVLSKIAISNIELINTHTMAAGIYTVTVYTPGRQRKHNQKVVKQ